jgi:hypothetical protein
LALRFASLKFDKFFIYFFNTSGKKEFSVPLIISDFSSDENIIFNNGALNSSGNKSDLNINSDDFKLSLTFNAAASSAYDEERIISNKKNDFLKWKLLKPKADVTGIFSVNSSAYNIRGIGYQDLVEFNIPPWRLSIKELHWGRAHCGKYAVVYDLVKFTDGNEFKKIALFAGNPEKKLVDSSEFEIIYESDKKETVIKFNGSQLTLTKLKTLTKESVYTDERIKPKFIRNILSSVSGDPFESKFYGKAALETEGSRFEGDSLYEIVKWN